MLSQAGLAWLLLLLAACSAPPKSVEGGPHHSNGSASHAAPTTRASSLVSPDPEAPAEPAPAELTTAEPAPAEPAPAEPTAVEYTAERVLEAVEGAWPVGEVVLAQTLDTDESGEMQRELFVVDGGSTVPLRRLSRALSLGQYVRVERAYGSWPNQVWLEVHADLSSELRLELHRIDVQPQAPRLMARLVGSMQTRLEAAELASGWLFLLHDPLANGSAGQARFAGSSPLPRPLALPKAGPDCQVPYEVCGLRRVETGGFELLAIRCEHTPVTLKWSDRTAKPAEREATVASTPSSCATHPDLHPVESRIDDSFSVAGRTWLVAGGALYRQRSSAETERPE